MSKFCRYCKVEISNLLDHLKDCRYMKKLEGNITVKTRQVCGCGLCECCKYQRVI